MRMFLQPERLLSETEIKQRRHQALLALLRAAPVRRQEELVERLAARGFEVTQSSVSRDLRELGVAKVGGRYVAPAAPGPDTEEVVGELAHYLRAAKPAGPHLTVVVTRTGAAQRVGIELDRAGWPEIVGTVAGDDTVFVATAGARDQSRLLARLRSLIAASPGTER